MTAVTFHTAANISCQAHAGVILAECQGAWFSVNGQTVRRLPRQPAHAEPCRFADWGGRVATRIRQLVEAA